MKRPRISIIPHHHDGPPELWVGKADPMKYQFNTVTALYFINVLSTWLQFSNQVQDGPSVALHGDE